MKVACLQFAPRLGMVDDNIQRANDILNSIPSSKSFDWLILPELAFSGTCLIDYNFFSRSFISLYGMIFVLSTPGPINEYAQEFRQLVSYIIFSYVLSFYMRRPIASKLSISLDVVNKLLTATQRL
jgi:predicted amidohydrolase